MAVYLVQDTNGNKTLVDTRTKLGAINFVAKKEYTAKSITTSELVQLIREGIEVQPTEVDHEPCPLEVDLEVIGVEDETQA